MPKVICLVSRARVGLLVATLGWPGGLSGRAAIEICREGARAPQIVVPDRPEPAEQFAARELSNYLHRIVGVSPTVVTESRAEQGTRLLVGRTRATRSARRVLVGEDPDSFLVQPLGGDLVLAGAGARGTIYAVYDLLERELGCRWLAPGSVWEEVPQADRICLSPASRVERPGFKYRYERMTYQPQRGSWEKACLEWAVRQRINIGYDWPTNRELARAYAPWGHFRGFMWPHSLPFLTDWNALRAEHPDWFALVNGVRKTDTPAYRANLCTTEPAVIEFVTGVLRSAFDAQPELEFLPLGPGDSVDFCECDRCRALDTGDTWVLSGRSYPGLSDRWLTFVNTVAERLARSHPRRKSTPWPTTRLSRRPAKCVRAPTS